MKKGSINYTLLIAVIIISLFGLIMIYSASNVWAEYKFDNPYKFVSHQAIFLVVGFVLLWMISKFHYSYLYEKANLILIACIVLLILVLIPGIGSVRNGSRSWFGIGSFGIQPSEFAKLGLILFTAKYLSRNQKSMKDIKRGVLPILGICLLVFGLIMLQPDFGTGIIIVISVLGLIFVSGVKMNFFVKMGAIGLFGITALIAVAPYRLKRILSFLNPWEDPLGSGFQMIQSLYAIGPGELFQK